jgi:hypothetical protein
MKERALCLACLLLLTALAAAQKSAGPKYDPATETTLNGVVDDVKEVPNSFPGQTGLHLMLKTDGGLLEVQVAPVSFLKDMEISFAKGEEVKIVGSKVTRNGNPLVLARDITRGNNEVVLRDKDGGPVWTWMKKG